MRRFLLARGAQALVVVALVATLAFVLVHVAPGDPFVANIFDDPTNTTVLRAQRMHLHGDTISRSPCSTVKWLGNLARGEGSRLVAFEEPARRWMC